MDPFWFFYGESILQQNKKREFLIILKSNAFRFAITSIYCYVDWKFNIKLAVSYNTEDIAHAELIYL